MGENTFKKGIFYSQRIMEKEYNVATIENAIIERLNENNIQIMKRFSDLGFKNLQRPGLNTLVNYLVNSEEMIDVIAFYSFDHLERDKKRLQFVLPRIQKYVKEVIFIHNIKDHYEYRYINNESSSIQNEIIGY